MKKWLGILFISFIGTFLFANVDATVGNIRIVIEDYTGALSVYRKNSDNTFSSMFDSKTFTKTPVFYVLYDDAVLPVSSAGGFKMESSFKDTRATVTAILKNKLELVIHYDLFSANDRGFIDSIKVSASVKNLRESSHEVGIKAIFDTWLGENTVTHFTTELRQKIVTETNFTNIENEKWIQSANLTDVVRFIFPEDSLSSIDEIVVANKTLLSQLNWYYSVQRGREFHSLNSYNNSALAITWDNFILSTEVYDDVSFFILTGEPSIQIPFTWPPKETPDITDFNISENAYSNLSQEDLKEILRILDTINTLKENNNYLSEQEILKLNAQVDAILDNARR